MRRPGRVLIAIVAVCASAVTLIAPAVAQPAADCPRPREVSEEFIGGSHEVKLRRSARYETVTFVSGSGGSLEPRIDDVNILRQVIERAKLGIVLQGPSMRQFGTLLVRLNEGVTPDQVQLLLQQIGRRNVVAGGDKQGNGNPIFDAGDVDHILVNQIIVQFRPTASQDDIGRLLAQYCARSVERSEEKAGMRYLLTFEGQTARHALAMVNHLNREKIVQYAQPDVIVIAMDKIASGPTSGVGPGCPAAPSTGSIDPYFPRQWFLDHSPAGLSGDPNADINAPQAWSVADGANIRVAILDDAVETTHEDLTGKIDLTWNAYTLTDDLGITDQDVHGTPVAGIVGAMTGNSVGVKRTATNVRLIPIRILRWVQGAPGVGEYPYWVVVRGIEKATAEHAHVISMSLSLGAYDLDSCDTRNVCQSALRDAVDAAIASGSVPVFAAGNDGATTIAFPAILAGTLPVIAVGATDTFDNIKLLLTANDWGSNQGPELSVVAPGLEIVTTDRTAAKGFCTGNYTSFLGTSASTPIVAGVAALMQSQYLAQGLPLPSPLQLKARLQQTAKDLGTPGFDNAYGHGRVDACKALKDNSCGGGGGVNPWLIASLSILAVSGLLWWVFKVARKKLPDRP